MKKLFGHLPQRANKSDIIVEENILGTKNVKKMVKNLEIKTEQGTSGKGTKGTKYLKQETGSPTPPRSKGGGGQILKKKSSNLTPLKSKFESKRDFFKKNFLISEFGASCGLLEPNYTKYKCY